MNISDFIIKYKSVSFYISVGIGIAFLSLICQNFFYIWQPTYFLLSSILIGILYSIFLFGLCTNLHKISARIMLVFAFTLTVPLLYFDFITAMIYLALNIKVYLFVKNRVRARILMLALLIVLYVVILSSISYACISIANHLFFKQSQDYALVRNMEYYVAYETDGSVRFYEIQPNMDETNHAYCTYYLPEDVIDLSPIGRWYLRSKLFSFQQLG